MDEKSAPEELIVRDEGPVRWIAIHRPASKNGLTLELNQQLIDAFETAGRQRSVRAVVLTGEGGAFSSGLDLKSAATSGLDMDGMEARIDRYFHALIRAARRVEKPVVALVDGPAIGFGCDLALACDIRLGTSRARFGEIFVKRGLMPDGGGTYHLPRLLGVGKAMELMLTGDIVEANDALRLGLMSRLLPTETAAAEALEYATRLAAGAPLVHAWVKRAVYAGLEGSLEAALAVERKGQAELIKSRDFFEGVSAFFQKRAPSFTGE